MDGVFLLSVLVLVHSMSPIRAQSLTTFYKCNTILVSGAKLYPTFNGFYEKVFECNQRGMYKLRHPSQSVFLFYREGESRWAIGKPIVLQDCGTLTKQYSIVGKGNKLYPHLVQEDWAEFSGATPQSNPDLTVECDDVFWTMGCSTVDFPLPKHMTRCHNATSAMEVQSMYVINYPTGEALQKCPQADGRCQLLGECDLNTIGLQCKKQVSKDDYEFKLVQKHCDGRHINCNPFRVDPLFHIDCDTRADFPCDQVTRPDVRDGIVVEYKCKRSKQYIGPEVAAEKVPDKPIQSLSSCSTTRSTRKVNENDPSSEKKTDATLINIVAPSAGALFAVIILAVIIVTVRRKRKQRHSGQAGAQEAIDKDKSSSNEYVTDNTYSNITSLGITPSPRPAKRPDIAPKKSKKSQQLALNGEMSANDLDAVVQAVVDANPELKGGKNGANNGMCAVVILDQQGKPIIPAHDQNSSSIRHGAALVSNDRNSPGLQPYPRLDPQIHSSGPSSRHSSHSRRSTNSSMSNQRRPASQAGYSAIRGSQQPMGMLPRLSNKADRAAPGHGPTGPPGLSHIHNPQGGQNNKTSKAAQPDRRVSPSQNPRRPVNKNPEVNNEDRKYRKKAGIKKGEQNGKNQAKGKVPQRNVPPKDGHLPPVNGTHRRDEGYNNHAYTT